MASRKGVVCERYIWPNYTEIYPGRVIDKGSLTKPIDGPVAKYVNRRLSTAITMFILERGIPVTPNQVSLISFLISVASALGFTLGVPALGGILAQVSSVVDGVDGELARARKMESRTGAFIDSMLDRYADVLIVASASVLSLGRFPEPWGLVIAVLAISGTLMVSYLHARSQYDLGVHPAVVGPLPSIASRDVRIFLVMVGGVLEHAVSGALAYSLVALALASHLYAAFKFVQVAALAIRGCPDRE